MAWQCVCLCEALLHGMSPTTKHSYSGGSGDDGRFELLQEKPSLSSLLHGMLYSDGCACKYYLFLAFAGMDACHLYVAVPLLPHFLYPGMLQCVTFPELGCYKRHGIHGS